MSLMGKVTATQKPYAQPEPARTSFTDPSLPMPTRNVFPAAQPQASVPQIRQLIITDAEIDKIGESVSRELGQTTQKIIEKMGVGKFDELGAILTTISAEADKLDPSSIQKGGVVGWLQNKFTDVKATLTLRLKTAQQVFNSLEDKISTHITTQTEWVSNMEELYNENFSHYQRIVAEMQEVDRLIEYCEGQIASWPEIDLNDPEAAMLVQLKRDAETKVNRLRLKRDNLLRLKAVTEINSPKIRQQQDASRVTISTLRDIVSQTIPIIKMEFAMFLQTLDVQKSVKLTSEVRNLASKTLTKGAEGAKIAAIESAKAMSTPVITNETLATLRSRMLETVVEVKRVEQEAVQRCNNDAQHLVEGQKSLLQALQQSGKL
jgi:uncharacterized protein YaaN involved in tellurite resistance